MSLPHDKRYRLSACKGKNIYSESLVDKESDFEHITADKSKPVGNNLSIYSIPVQMYINSIYM